MEKIYIVYCFRQAETVMYKKGLYEYILLNMYEAILDKFNMPKI